MLSICSNQFFSSQDVTIGNYIKLDKVIDYVGRKSLRLRDLGIAIKEFKLIMDYVDHKYMAHRVDLWMKMAIESGGEVLHLQLGLLGDFVLETVWTDHLISHCPLIEDLTVIDCAKLKKVNVKGMHEVYIDASNLESLDYCIHPYASFKLNLDSCTNLRWLRLWNLKSIDLGDEWFLELFSKIKPEQGAWQVSSIPPTIKRLELLFSPEDEALYFPFMNYLLSNCCPNYTSFLYEMLMGSEEECHCSSSNSKCWWHALKSVKVLCTFKIDENADFDTMLDALPTCYSHERVGFMLEL
ncbi:uncharacterized protein LOC107464138 [Arachis duranensis]|uniref:Uncharacterized protein LOC107464138 n=1 Tax=Arachis duranensis TaxID=130453 RepID=A0A6P4C479_ARADU|nr:uncharacterized protein LOC107464138 [Arachis duranensis]